MDEWAVYIHIIVNVMYITLYLGRTNNGFYSLSGFLSEVLHTVLLPPTAKTQVVSILRLARWPTSLPL